MRSKDEVRVIIAIGANIAPKRNIELALSLLQGHCHLDSLSTFYQTKAIDRPEQPDYLNGMARIFTSLPARTLKFDILRTIETSLGRVRTEDKYVARPIDLDIIAYGAEVSTEPDLCIPDDDLRTRSFLAAGMLELEPTFQFPDSGEFLASLWDAKSFLSLVPAHDFTHYLRERLLHE